MAILARSPKTGIFWKSAKGGPRVIFQKSPKKVALVWKAQKHSGANGIILYLVCPYSAKTGKHFGANSGSKSAWMAKLWQFLQGHPKPAFSEKVQRGEQEKFLKNRPKRFPRLKGPKAFWRKWHYSLISMQLKCKDWTRSSCKQRLQKCANGQLMAILARSPKTCIFWKKEKGGPRESFQNRPKSSPRLKGPKALWRKWHYPLLTMCLKCKDRKTFWRKQRLQKCPNGQVMVIFSRSPKTCIFWKSAKGGPQEIFQKSPKK